MLFDNGQGSCASAGNFPQEVNDASLLRGLSHTNGIGNEHAERSSELLKQRIFVIGHRFSSGMQPVQFIEQRGHVSLS